MENLSVIRLHLSPYFSTDFQFQEKIALEQLANVNYLNLGQWQQATRIALITDTHVKLDELPTGVLEKTHLVLHPNSGHDNLHQGVASTLKAPIILGHELRSHAVAEYVWARLWQSLVKIPQHLTWNKDRNWDRELISQKKVLLIGRGEIGRILEKWSSGPPWVWKSYDPFIGPQLPNSIEEIRRGILGAIKETCPNIIILCCSLNPSSRYIIDKQSLSLAPKDLIIINAARGGLINQQDLFDFLKQNPRAQAYLDVYEHEPAPLAQLSTYDNFYGTSHIAGVFNGLEKKTIDWESIVLNDFLRKPKDQFERSYLEKTLNSRLIRLRSAESFFI